LRLCVPLLGLGESLLELAQELERFQGRHAIRVDALELRDDPVLDVGEERELTGARGSRALSRETRPALDVELVFLQVDEDLLGPSEEARRKPGEAGHLDSVAPIRSSFEDFPEEDDVVVPFPGGNVAVDDAGKLRREIRELVVVGGEDGLGFQAMCSATDQASESPS
jgi:hypothetical protein